MLPALEQWSACAQPDRLHNVTSIGFLRWRIAGLAWRSLCGHTPARSRGTFVGG